MEETQLFKKDVKQVKEGMPNKSMKESEAGSNNQEVHIHSQVRMEETKRMNKSHDF